MISTWLASQVNILASRTGFTIAATNAVSYFGRQKRTDLTATTNATNAIAFEPVVIYISRQVDTEDE